MIRNGIRSAFQLALRRRDRWERDVEDEIKLHLALRAEQLMTEGVAQGDAYTEAVRRFGPLTESRERLLDAARHREERMHRTEYLADLGQDLGFALRTLRRDKGWTAVTLVTVALGIAATTAVFSAVSSLLLHAVPYPGADRVVLAYQEPTQGNNTGVNVTIIPTLKVIRAWKEAHAFEAVQAYSGETMQLRTTGEPAPMQIERVEPTFPRFAGSQPLLGRMFTPDEARSDAHVAVLGEGMWRTRFGGEPSAIGKTITLDDSIYTVVGVLPSRVQPPVVGGTPVDVWLPMNASTGDGGAQLVARLRPGVVESAVTQELDSLAARISPAGELRFRAVLTTPAKRVSFHDSLIMLAASVGLVLLVACANVAHLLMARSAARGRELAIRVALGAGRGRVFRQLLTESVVLTVAGGLLGVGGGWLGLRAIVGLRPASLQSLAAARLDATTLGIAVAVTAATSLVFGLMGAVQSSRFSTVETIKGSANRRSKSRGRQLLVVTEMALSATLVVGAAMLVRSVSNMQRADLGFESHGLYSLTFSAPKGHFSSDGARGAARRELATRLRTLPGVSSVAFASSPPGWFNFRIGRLEVDGQTSLATPATSFNSVLSIGTGYLQTMGMRLVAGAGFTDTAGANQVFLNEKFVRKQWPGQAAIGKRIRVSQKGDEPWQTVVGVVRDVQTGGPMSESTAAVIYSPVADSEAISIMFRTSTNADLLSKVKALVASVDPALTPKLGDVQSIVEGAIAAPRFVMLLLTVFTVLALLLAAVGLYGVMAYMVAQRTREIGIRVALGAPSARIARGVIAGGVWLALVGTLIGAGVSFWGTKLIESQLFGVAQRDPASMIAAGVVLFCVAVVACVVPARRALAVDPMTAIRAD